MMLSRARLASVPLRPREKVPGQPREKVPGQPREKVPGQPRAMALSRAQPELSLGMFTNDDDDDDDDDDYDDDFKSVDMSKLQRHTHCA